MTLEGAYELTRDDVAIVASSQPGAAARLLRMPGVIAILIAFVFGERAQEVGARQTWLVGGVVLVALSFAISLAMRNAMIDATLRRLGAEGRRVRVRIDERDGISLGDGDARRRTLAWSSLAGWARALGGVIVVDRAGGALWLPDRGFPEELRATVRSIVSTRLPIDRGTRAWLRSLVFWGLAGLAVLLLRR